MQNFICRYSIYVQYLGKHTHKVKGKPAAHSWAAQAKGGLLTIFAFSW
jgi:hypothetical protein